VLTEIRRRYPNMPSIWGEGAIFGFSGIDGETSSATGFVATYARQPYSLLFQTPTRRALDFLLKDPGEMRIAVGDVLAAETPNGVFLAAFTAWHTLIGVLPIDTVTMLSTEDGKEAVRDGVYWVSEDVGAPDALVGVQRGLRFVVSYGSDVAEAKRRADETIEFDAYLVAEHRLAAYENLPRLEDPGNDCLLKKCFSVMKVNTLAREDVIRQRWSTPDRVPHKDMWLWDSVFHSLAMDRFLPQVAWEDLKSVLDTQNPDGFIPHQSSVSGRQSSVTQPPLLAWGVWENYQALSDKSCLAYALPKLEAYLEWNLENRDQNGNGLLEWKIDESARCRCGESGLDNSPRFDRGVPLDSVDFSSIQAHDMEHVARIASELGDEAKAKAWSEKSEELAGKVHAELWDEDDGIYYDRDLDGNFEGVQAVSGFFPLMLPDMPEGRAERLVEALNDPERFNAAFPVPTVAVSDPNYSTDMWRGCTWANTNYLVIHGLRRQGQKEEADRLAAKTIQFVRQYYEQCGVLFEFFDSSDESPPFVCDRKGRCEPPYDIRKKVQCIRDYHWTAAVTALLLLGT